LAASNGPTQPAVEREKLLNYLLSIYHAPQRLRTHHRKIARSILSLKQGYDGLTKGRCFMGEERDLDLLQLHHKDGVESHNEIDNLDLACSTHNLQEDWIVRRRKKAELRQTEKEREKESVASAGLVAQPRTEQEAWEGLNRDGVKAPAVEPFAVPTSLETEKAERMRPAWDKWVRNMKKGPFAPDGKPKLRAIDLAEMAHHSLGEGSSETYRRYIKEDRWGPLEYWKEDGVWWVKYRGPMSASDTRAAP
jgi:hypothetical protein